MLNFELKRILFTINHQPSTINHQPSTNNQQPTTNNQQPTTNNQNPTPKNQQHSTHTFPNKNTELRLGDDQKYRP